MSVFFEAGKSGQPTKPAALYITNQHVIYLFVDGPFIFEADYPEAKIWGRRSMSCQIWRKDRFRWSHRFAIAFVCASIIPIKSTVHSPYGSASSRHIVSHEEIIISLYIRYDCHPARAYAYGGCASSRDFAVQGRHRSSIVSHRVYLCSIHPSSREPVTL